MKAYRIEDPGGLDHLSIVEGADPTPGPEEVLVRWHASSLNFHDYLVAIGAIRVPAGRIPMSDGAGEVVAIGSEVNLWKAGDKVMSMFFPGWTEGRPEFTKIVGVSGETIDGYMAELSSVHQNSITRIPEGYSYEEAATLPCAGLTAWNALMHANNTCPGQTILIEGTGGVSIFGLQFAMAAGAEVYATSSSPTKAKELLKLGCKAVVNYRDDERWGKTIFSLSEGGVDQVLDVGGGSTMKQSVEALKIGGTVTSIGILGNGRKGEITFPKLFFKFVRIQGIAVGSRMMQEAMVRGIESCQIKPIIDKVFQFDQLADAFRYQAEGKHFGKIVLSW